VGIPVDAEKINTKTTEEVSLPPSAPHNTKRLNEVNLVCVCVCACACVRACVRACMRGCVRVCVNGFAKRVFHTHPIFILRQFITFHLNYAIELT